MRLWLIVLSAAHLVWSIPALFFPRWFFDNFPGFGQQWTAAYPPYNEHLMTDVGGAVTALGVLLLIGAFVNDLKVTRTVLTGVIIFSGFHLGYHLAHHGTLAGPGLAASLASLIFGFIVPIGLLLVSGRYLLPNVYR